MMVAASNCNSFTCYGIRRSYRYFCQILKQVQFQFHCGTGSGSNLNSLKITLFILDIKC